MTTNADLIREAHALHAAIKAGNWRSVLEASLLLPQLADALEVESRCTTCDGHLHASGRVCICGGSGKRSEETLNMRQALQAAEARLAKVRERAIDNNGPHDSCHGCHLCRLCSAPWREGNPERHNLPDCPARPMEDA